MLIRCFRPLGKTRVDVTISVSWMMNSLSSPIPLAASERVPPPREFQSHHSGSAPEPVP
jgi:hypothetical protein